VVYIIKENRSYDQVSGMWPKAMATPLSACLEDATPNQHKLVKDSSFGQHLLFRHISADGHQWADTAFATDYMEKSFAGFREAIRTAWMTMMWTLGLFSSGIPLG